MLDPIPEPPRLALLGICKAYPGIVANDRIDLRVSAGAIHAVLGENGAGKSTLMKIIGGVVRPDRGQLFWEGRSQVLSGPSQARSLGITMMFQHFCLFESLTVAENVALALPAGVAGAGLAMRIQALAESFGLPVQPHRLVGSLSLGERQRVELVRCLLQNPRLLILDEPTSVLSRQAASSLFATLRQVAAEGCSILYISHRLDEIRELAQHATVLRGGRVVGTCIPAQETTQTLARMMIGADLPVYRAQRQEPGTEVRLRIHGLSVPAAEPGGSALRNLELMVRSGEILGIAGAAGNGQAELLRVISGEARVPAEAGLSLLGVAAGGLGPARRRALGLGFVPEERLGRAAVPGFSLTENALLTAHRLGMVRSGLIRFGVARRFAEACIRRFSVTCAGPGALARTLSGGNLQKFIVARELSQGPKLLLVAQPTWGVDAGATALIRRSLVELRQAGTAILVVSEDLEELFELCDRLQVMAKGALSPSRWVADTGPEEIGTWMSGLWPGPVLAGGSAHA